MTTFYLLYVVVGAGIGNYAWGGPALLRFEHAAECEAAAAVMKTQKNIDRIECLRVSVRSQ